MPIQPNHQSTPQSMKPSNDESAPSELGTNHTNYPINMQIKQVFDDGGLLLPWKRSAEIRRSLGKAFDDWNQALQSDTPEEKDAARANVFACLNNYIKRTLPKHNFNINSVEELQNNQSAIQEALKQNLNKINHTEKQHCPYGLGTGLGLWTASSFAIMFGGYSLADGALAALPGLAIAGFSELFRKRVTGQYHWEMHDDYSSADPQYREAEFLQNNIGSLTRLIENMSDRVQPQRENGQQANDELSQEWELQEQQTSLLEQNNN